MNRDQITNMLAKNRDLLGGFGVKGIYLFGSAAREEATESSDIDLLVEFAPDAKIGLLGFARLQSMLSDMLGKKVDITTPDALHKELKNSILRDAVHAI